MQHEINKCPPLKGTVEQKLEQLRTHQNRVVDELTKTVSTLERELERIPKENVRKVARENIEAIRTSNRRDFRF